MSTERPLIGVVIKLAAHHGDTGIAEFVAMISLDYLPLLPTKWTKLH